MTKSSVAPYLTYLTLLLYPFLMLYWMLPFVSNVTLGNDYQLFFIHYQLELMFSLKTGSFPLFIPGFCGGQTASALCLGQFFHPISHIASWLPGYWQGRALEWNTFLKLLTLGVTHVALFAFLRKLKVPVLMTLCLSTLTVYNLRMLTFFLDGAAHEAYTGHLLLCVAIGWYWFDSSKKGNALFITFATYWVICSGHPQKMYYACLGAGLFTLLIPFFLAEICPEQINNKNNIITFWLRVAFFCFLGILLSSAFISGFCFDFMALNTARVGQSYAWADGFKDTLMGTVNNFFYPLRSSGGLFGGSSLILIAVLIPLLRLFKQKIPSVIWIIWGISLLFFLYIQGGRTPVHYIAWKYLPFASSFRSPGRISVIMPILILMLLVWVLKKNPFQIKLGSRHFWIAPSSVLSLASIAVIGVYLCLPELIKLDINMFCPKVVREVPLWIEQMALLLGVIVLSLLAIYGTGIKKNRIFGILLCFFVFSQLMIYLHFGTWISQKMDMPSFHQLHSEKRLKLKYHYSHNPGHGLTNKIVLKQCENSCLEPFLGKVYSKYIAVDNNDEAYALIRKDRRPDTAIVEVGKNSFPQQNIINDGTSWVELRYSSFNRLIFDVHTMNPGYFVLAYPFTNHWKAWVNNKTVKVARANGYANAVYLSSGNSQVEFRYWSSSVFWGMIVSCTTLAIIIFFICYFSIKAPYNLLAGCLSIIIVLSLFFIWMQSLYTGTNLHTQYAWKSGTIPVSNLAYWKKATTDPKSMELYPTLFSGGLVVDGDRSLNSGLLLYQQRNPSWVVDLHHPRSIGWITIYEGKHNNIKINNRPLIIGFSKDKVKWKSSMIYDNSRPLVINFKSPPVARYVMIRASGSCRLSLDEVEIYPPVNKP